MLNLFVSCNPTGTKGFIRRTITVLNIPNNPFAVALNKLKIDFAIYVYKFIEFDEKIIADVFNHFEGWAHIL